jgi:hypothetical protein
MLEDARNALHNGCAMADVPGQVREPPWLEAVKHLARQIVECCIKTVCS